MKNVKDKIKKKYNLSIKNRIKNFVKKINFLIKEKDIISCNENIKKFQSLIDNKSRKNIINKNKSSRIKSKLMKKINLINKNINE